MITFLIVSVLVSITIIFGCKEPKLTDHQKYGNYYKSAIKDLGMTQEELMAELNRQSHLAE